MAADLKFPEKTRERLFSLWKEAQAAQATIDKYTHAMMTGFEMMGLDPSLNHGLNWETGVVTPAEAPTKPTLVKDEAAS